MRPDVTNDATALAQASGGRLTAEDATIAEGETFRKKSPGQMAKAWMTLIAFSVKRIELRRPRRDYWSVIDSPSLRFAIWLNVSIAISKLMKDTEPSA